MKITHHRLTIALIILLVSWTASLGSAAQISFEIDPTSSLVLAAKYSQVPLEAQGPGSLTTTYNGTLTVDVDDLATPATIDFLSSSIIAANSGNWLPEVGGGTPGSPGTAAPANYASFNATGFLAGDVYGAVRGLELDMATPGGALAVTGGTTFPSTQTFTVMTGTLDFNIQGGWIAADASSGDYSGQSDVNQAAGSGSYSRGGSIVTLVIPISTNIQILDSSGEEIGSANLSGTLTATADISTGDFDQDGDQDGNDFVTWQQGFGTLGSAVLADGDGNYDGDVLNDDLALWNSSFGVSGASFRPTIGAVPEPSSLVLLGLAWISLTFRRERRQK